MKKHEKKSTVLYIEQQNCPNNHFKNSLEIIECHYIIKEETR